MKRHGILSVVLSILFIISILFYGCETGKGGPSDYPTVSETFEMIRTAHIGYPPDADDEFYYTCSYPIILIDIFFEVVNLFLDPEYIEYQGSGGTYTASYSEEGVDLTLTLEITWDSSKEMWHYLYFMDGTIPGETEPIELNNFKLFEMYAKEDGSEGEITFYSYEEPDSYMKINWDIGSTYATFTLYCFTTGEGSFTFLLKETIPYYNELTEPYYFSESGSWRLELEGEEPIEESGSWGSNPPSLG
jgi:hypothetical protein